MAVLEAWAQTKRLRMNISENSSPGKSKAVYATG
jgi:hypothetical protein